ncbi:transposase [Paenibacillus beijingensis]|uniref:Transposase zinc-ribbon domain-containing protein n=1 Tax=Paenibacillus beijingensis TaxID=1126833 RepID=A0A0D5NKE2_9BACL|nr:transposase [Paenibacillus beijingensis]AJY75398.1 hypothetical protein VN24_13505 [Paenibacillus beijingensis]
MIGENDHPSITGIVKGVIEAQQAFSIEEECIEFLFRLKWPAGYLCPKCGCSHAYTITTRRLPLYECSYCGHQTSLTANTMMEKSRTPLHKWLTALSLVSCPDSAINAVQLADVLDVTYKTAWSMLHKIRRAISIADHADPLLGQVQAGLVLYGRQVKTCDSATCPLPANPPVSKHPLILGVGYDVNEEPVQLKLKIVPQNHMSGHHLFPSGKRHFIEQWGHAGMLEEHICAKRFIFYRNRSLIAIFRSAEAWINRTFHGIGRRHLQLYLDEFCFRFQFRDRPHEALSRLVSFCLSVCPNARLSQKVI